MDALLIVVIGGLLVLGLWSSLARRHAPERPAGRRTGGPLGGRSAREIVEARAGLEAEDLAQMLEASNARRRRRGEPERTVAEVEALVASGMRAQRGRTSLAERELDQLLQATNARRRARGLPERTREDVRGESPAGS